ncbi:MAG TPA: metal-dependent transcriptional regulator, partial [Anaerolineales bacterium]|nr:metal-dependent transcriptional regulator [Anaerolineales bacterium]
MYLKSLFELSDGDRPASIAAVADRLGVTPVSASEMVHRLERRRLVVHRRYRGVHLTGEGRRLALALIRRHRLWECFLHTELGLPWEAVHEAACELEHAAPDTVTEALAQRLGNPARCPHGNPIPDREHRIVADASRPLATLQAGQAGHLVSVSPETT